MTEFPSSAYLLLTHPSWLQHANALPGILHGIATWDFDPNEQHDGVPILRGMLEHVSTLSLNEPHLMQVVQALLDRGADPAGAFSGKTTRVQWRSLPGVKHLLANAAMPQSEQARDPRGASVFAALREPQGPDRVVSLAQVKLGAKGLEDCLDGLNAGAWCALMATNAGEALPGWCVPQVNYGGEVARVVRTARKAVVAGNLLQSGTPLDRVVAALGLASVANLSGSSQDDKAAQDAALNTSKKLLQGVDAARVLREAAHGPQLSREQKSRLGVSLLRGVGLIAKPGEAWDVIVSAWPLLEDVRLDLSWHTIGPVLNHGLPHAHLARIAPSASNQRLLLDLLVASVDRFAPDNETLREGRLLMIEAMGRWRAGQNLPEPDVDRLATYIRTTDPTRVRGVMEALEAMAIDSATAQGPRAHRTTPRL